MSNLPLLAQIIENKSPHWNKKIYSLEDFYQICTEIKVRVMESDLFKHKGEYAIHEDIPFILLKKTIQREEKLWIALHELGHHYLHFPTNHKFSKGIIKKMDRQANFFAAIALMPTSMITTMTLDAIKEEYNYPHRLILIRKEIFDVYKI